MEKILIIAAVFTAGFFAGAKFDSSSERAPVNNAAVATADVQQLQDKIADLNRYVKALESRTTLPVAPVTPVNQTLSSPDPLPAAAEDNHHARELERLREYQFINEIAKRQARMRERGADIHNLGITMEQQFSFEAIDAAWAEDKKSHLNAAIEQDENLRALPNLSSECRSRKCRLSILTNDADQLAGLNASLNKIVTQQQLFDSYTVVVDEKNFSTQIYFDRAVTAH